MYANRFDRSADCFAAKTNWPSCKTYCGFAARYVCFDGYFCGSTLRSSRDRVCTVLVAIVARSGFVGPRQDVDARKWPPLYAERTEFRGHTTHPTRRSQSSARCFMGDGGRGCLRWFVCCCWRNKWRACCLGFYRNQADSTAVRTIWCACLAFAQRRHRGVISSARTLAIGIAPVRDRGAQWRRTRSGQMASDPFSSARTAAGNMDSAV